MKCEYCGRDFERYAHKISGSRAKPKRKSNSKTCSGKCSKLLVRKKHPQLMKEYYQRRRNSD